MQRHITGAAKNQECKGKKNASKPSDSWGPWDLAIFSEGESHNVGLGGLADVSIQGLLAVFLVSSQRPNIKRVMACWLAESAEPAGCETDVSLELPL
jgi:hypothetical protein